MLWIFFFLLTLLFVLYNNTMAFSPFKNFDYCCLSFHWLSVKLKTILVLIGMVFELISEMFHEMISLNLMFWGWLIGALICFMKFLFPDIALDLYKSNIQPCMEYCCCHVWAGTPSCFLELFDKLQKWIYMTFAPLLAVPPLLEPLAHHHPNVTNLKETQTFKAY